MEDIPQESASNDSNESLREEFKRFDATCNEFIKDGGVEDINVLKTLGAHFVSSVAQWAVTRGYEQDDAFFEQIFALDQSVGSYFESNLELLKQDVPAFLDGLHKIAAEQFPQK